MTLVLVLGICPHVEIALLVSLGVGDGVVGYTGRCGLGDPHHPPMEHDPKRPWLDLRRGAQVDADACRSHGTVR